MIVQMANQINQINWVLDEITINLIFQLSANAFSHHFCHTSFLFVSVCFSHVVLDVSLAGFFSLKMTLPLNRKMYYIYFYSA